MCETQPAVCMEMLFHLAYLELYFSLCTRYCIVFLCVITALIYRTQYVMNNMQQSMKKE